MTKHECRMTKRSIRVAPAAWTRRPRRALARTRKRRGRRFYFVAPIAFGASTKKKRPPCRGALRLRQIEPIDAYAPPPPIQAHPRQSGPEFPALGLDRRLR